MFDRSFGRGGLETGSQRGPAERLVNVTESAAGAVPHKQACFSQRAAWNACVSGVKG